MLRIRRSYVHALFAAFAVLFLGLVNILPAYAGQDDDLLAAVRRGDAEAAARLLGEGADPNAASGKGVSALMEAAGNGDVKIVGMLLDRGADVNAVDKNGMSAGSHAARNGRKYALDKLIDAGASLEARDASGQTLSDHARAGGHSHIADGLEAKAAATAGELDSLRDDMMDSYRKGDYEAAADRAGAAYDRAVALYGEKDPRSMAALNDLALMSMRAGRTDEAGERYERAYELSGEVYGEVSRESAVAANNLGVYHYTMNNRHAAAEYYDIACETSKKLGGEEELSEEFSNNLALAVGGGAGGKSGRNAPSMPGNESVGTTTWGDARAASPVFRGGGEGGGSGVFGSIDADSFGLGWYGLSDEHVTILINLLIILVSCVAGYIIYRLLMTTLYSSQERKATAIFDAKMNLGYARFMERVEKLPSAAIHYERALAVFDRDALSRFRLARVYEKMGEKSLAIRHYRHVMTLLPPEHALRRDATDSVMRLGDKTAASLI